MRHICCRLLGIFVFCAIATLTAGATRADEVTYTLTGSVNPEFGPTHAESFQFTSNGFITAYTDLTPSQLTSCVACAEIEFYPNGTLNSVIPVDMIRFTDADGIIYGFFFDPGDFSAVGTYTAQDFPPYITSNIGTLTVTTTAVPEPSVSLLLMLGLTGLFGFAVVRSRRSRQTQLAATPA